jgi:hypothetical protein
MEEEASDDIAWGMTLPSDKNPQKVNKPNWLESVSAKELCAVKCQPYKKDRDLFTKADLVQVLTYCQHILAIEQPDRHEAGCI